MKRLVIWWFILLLALGGCRSMPPKPEGTPSTTVETERFRLSASDLAIGQLARIPTEEEDTLADIARHFGLGFQALRDANPDIDPWLPPVDRDVLLPLAFILPEAPRSGIVLNLAAMRLFYFPPDRPDEVWSYPVGIGREGWETPRGVAKIVRKEANPNWIVPPSIRQEHAQRGERLPSIVPPGPDNPLGAYALRLSFPGYLIHGTNKPYGIGLRVSHGCIQLYPEDIAALFPHVSVGTEVTIVDQPYLVGWRQGELYLQAHAPLRQDAKTLHTLRQRLMQRLRRIERDFKVAVDWQRVDQALAEARGIPLPITKDSMPWQVYLEQAPVLDRPPSWPHQYQPPAATPGWYLLVDYTLSSRAARRLVAILRHQAPPLPARLILSERGEQVVIGPFPGKTEAAAIKQSLNPDLRLPIRLLPPSQSEAMLSAKSHSLPLVSSRKASP